MATVDEQRYGIDDGGVGRDDGWMRRRAEVFFTLVLSDECEGGRRTLGRMKEEVRFIINKCFAFQSCQIFITWAVQIFRLYRIRRQ